MFGLKDVRIRPERCLGCRSCEVACAVEHSQSKSLFSALGENPVPKKRIHVEHMPALNAPVPMTCRNCENAPCVSTCPTKALSQDAATNFVSHDRERCVDCWICSTVCPRFISLYHLILVMGCWSSSMRHNYGVVNRETDTGDIIKCDLCQGKELPACVEACPTNALVYSDVKDNYRDSLDFLLDKNPIL